MTSTPARLIVEPPAPEGDWLVLAASLDDPAGTRHRLWWKVPAAVERDLTAWADPFVVGFCTLMMQWKRPVVVAASVSPSLLAELELFMAIWSVWYPHRYRQVDIRGEDETEAPAPADPDGAIMAFSCGVDSAFTAYRHHHDLAGRRRVKITAGAVMHGFDIVRRHRHADDVFERLAARARIVLDDLGMQTIPMVSNFRELPLHRWDDAYGAQLVGGLRLLAGRYGAGVIANSKPYSRLGATEGSNPVTDPHLGSARFRVVDDGGQFARAEKIELLARWPLALERLRVCFSNEGSVENCCRCAKCVRTMLAFRAAGCALPACFGRDADDRMIRRLRHRRAIDPDQWREVARSAELRGLGGASWVRAIHQAIRRNRWRRRYKAWLSRFAPVRNFIRRVFRGSPLSRSERARRQAQEP